MNYVDLGATLFVPATHKHLFDVVCKRKYKELKSVLVDTEDGIDAKELPQAKEQIIKLLKSYEKNECHLFIRPKDVKFLKELLSMEGIEKVDGFVLPKFSLSNANAYLKLLHTRDFYIMPSIEGCELFEREKLKRLKEMLVEHKEKILLIRFGLEDMLRQLGMKRDCNLSIFDYAVTNVVLGEFLALFKSSGFAVSGGVYPCFENKEGFIKDVERDLREGLFSKTIIHPNHISFSNEIYKVKREELDWAKAILQSGENIFAHKQSMVESQTMTPYAQEILRRFEVYGVKEL